MKYTEVEFQTTPLDPTRDLLTYSLGDEGDYDSFVETPNGLKAYVPTELFDPSQLDAVVAELKSFNPQLQIAYTVTAMPDKNWNEEWEKQHQPVLVEASRRIWVRAPFHEHRNDVDYELEIEPKMSFGTAHHPTTYLMLSYIADIDVQGLRVLDMGCGTAVLGILAAKRGASSVEGIDVDEWAYNNALENVQRNQVEMAIHIGDAALLEQPTIEPFDLVIANINRNILLHDMAHYTNVLRQGGILLLSGFYETDVPALVAKAATLGLTLQEQRTRDGWTALKLKL